MSWDSCRKSCPPSGDANASYVRYLSIAESAWRAQCPWPAAAQQRQRGRVPAGRVPSLSTQAVNVLDTDQTAASQDAISMHSAGSLPHDSQQMLTRFASATRPATALIRQFDETVCPAQTLAFA